MKNITFSVRERELLVQQLADEEFDLLVIGGGINGAGVARDAASRGLRVALIEADDFASGTSSRSSKLIHGGIRYLEKLEFRLVFEALNERTRLFAMAPHLVHPLRFVLPLYDGGRVGMFKMGLGMMLYDLLASFDAPEGFERLSKRESLARLSMLREPGLLGSYVYSDAYMDDDRLVLETLRDAHRRGAVCANYVSMTGGLWEGEAEDRKLRGAQCLDRQSGQAFAVRARHVVSTLGPWTDLVGKELLPDWKPILRPSKGVHITLDRGRLPLTSAVVMAADKSQRIVFAIPRHDMIIVGTTDTDFPDDPRDVHTTTEDVDYLLEVAGHYFPGANLTRADILASYAGVRPLVDDGAGSESQVSREHKIWRDPRGITFVVGGKYTTYRKMAEDTVAEALRSFPLAEQVRFARSATDEPLNPRVDPELYERALASVERWSSEQQIPLAIMQNLVERFGEEACDLFLIYNSYIANGSTAELAYWQTLAEHAIEQTMCVHLLDFYLRRTPLFLSYRDHGFAFLAELADLFARRLLWSSKQRAEEVSRVHEHVRHEMCW